MSNPEQKLSQLRARIDAVDESMAKLMLERIAIVREVAALKAEHWPADCHIRNGREGQMHRAIADRFAGTDIQPAAALAIWRQLIGAATQLESPLSIATLDRDPHHPWLAREYFGVGVTIHSYSSIEALLDSVAKKQSNLALISQPLAAHIWPEAELLATIGFTLFASLPVTTQPLPNHANPALAFAAITPEPSGDDLSYFLRDGRVDVIDGFQSTSEDALFIGTYPRPVALFNSSPSGGTTFYSIPPAPPREGS
jgi:chorismate mutase